MPAVSCSVSGFHSCALRARFLLRIRPTVTTPFSCAARPSATTTRIGYPHSAPSTRFRAAHTNLRSRESFSIQSHATFSMSASTEKTVLVPIANGTEEMEAVIIIDVLRRAGAKVVVASIESELGVTCSRGVKLVADLRLDEVDGEFDLIALPGGAEGATRLRGCAKLEQMLCTQHSKNKLLAAICASPAVVLEPLGLLKDDSLTRLGIDRVRRAAETRVVLDGALTTSRGPGTAFEFALSLVEQLYGAEKMRQVADPMVMHAV